MSRKEKIFWGCVCLVVFGPLLVMLSFSEPGPPFKVNIGCPPCQAVTIAVPGPVAVIRADGSTILVNEKEFTLPAGDTRFTVRVMDGKAVNP